MFGGGEERARGECCIKSKDKIEVVCIRLPVLCLCVCTGSYEGKCPMRWASGNIASLWSCSKHSTLSALRQTSSAMPGMYTDVRPPAKQAQKVPQEVGPGSLEVFASPETAESQSNLLLHSSSSAPKRELRMPCKNGSSLGSNEALFSLLSSRYGDPPFRSG